MFSSGQASAIQEHLPSSLHVEIFGTAAEEASQENPLENADLRVGLEPDVRGSGRSSVLARASSKVYVEMDPIEEPAIYEILPNEF